MKSEKKGATLLSVQKIFRLNQDEAAILERIQDAETESRGGAKVTDSDVIRMLIMTSPKWIKAKK